MIEFQYSNLPIAQILDEIKHRLTKQDQLIIEAEPGAGKTTLVPLAILEHQIQAPKSEQWLEDKKIIMLEPRRIAARNAAIRMADLLGEKVGQTVGYRMRGENKTSAQTRVEVVTQGVLTRMLQADPALETVGAVIFDEFHERQLDSDLALSLCQYSNELLREANPIKLIVMSATLERIALNKVLDQTEALFCAGRSYNVAVLYRPVKITNQKHSRTAFTSPKQQMDQLLDHTVETTLDALSQHRGSILVFLPGIREIKRCQMALEQALCENTTIKISPLYGGLSSIQQQEAIQACENGTRKVVLTTSIAETSLTIDGVSVVIDSGLSRYAEFNHTTGLSRLVTKPVSKSTATQRMGRAGRLSHGTCYRLWSEQSHHQKQEHTPPEIQQSDLTDTLLQLAVMGIAPSDLRWIDVPPQGHLSSAIDRLKTLKAIEVNTDKNLTTATERGYQLAQLPVPAMIASMLEGCENHLKNAVNIAIKLAALLLDGDILYSSSNTLSADIGLRLKALETSKKQDFPAHHATIEALIKYFSNLSEQSKFAKHESHIGELCALALPHRIAKRVDGTNHHYKLATGETVALDENDALQKHEWLVVLDVFTRNKSSHSHQLDMIRMATPISLSALLNPQGLLTSIELTHQQTIIGWQDASDQLIATQSAKIGCLTLSEKKLDNLTPEVKLTALLNWIKQAQLECLPWSDDTRNLQARISLINQSNPDLLPDLSDKSLLATLDQWLSPYLHNITKQKQLEKLPLEQILQGLLTWEQQQTLEQLAPTHIKVPSDSKVKIDYTQNPPVMAVKLQEMFGCTETPTINQGKTALMIHLLSPAKRPLQITQDLSSFWKNGYQEVKKENKAKYAKHPWPDDPIQATATRLTNRKLREKYEGSGTF